MEVQSNHDREEEVEEGKWDEVVDRVDDGVRLGKGGVEEEEDDVDENKDNN